MKYIPCKTITALSLVLSCSLLLGGCGSAPKGAAPQATPAPVVETTLPAEEVQLIQDESAELLQAEGDEATDRILIHIERTRKDAMDPAEGRTRILEYVWDNVRVESAQHPEAAAVIAEDMAARQDVW